MKKLLLAIVALCAPSFVPAVEPGKTYPTGVTIAVTGRMCFSAGPAMEIATADVEMGREEGKTLYAYHEEVHRCVYARGVEISFTEMIRPVEGKYGVVEVWHGNMHFQMSNVTRSVYVLTDLPGECSTDLPKGHACT